MNLLTKTEQFDAAVWAKVAASVVPDALSTADRIVATAVEGAHGITHTFSIQSQRRYVFKLFLTPDKYKGLVLNVGGTAYTAINLETATVTTNVSSGVASEVVGGVRQLVDGRYECSFAFTCSAPDGQTNIRIYMSNSATVATNVPSFMGDGVSGVYLWSASLTLATDAHLPYQRVNTSVDYDADPAKFPAYLRLDGVDDALQTGNIDFTGTDKMTVWAGVESAHAGLGVIAELSASASTNPNSFLLAVRDSGLFDSFYASGATGQANTRKSFSVTTRLLTASADLSGPTTNMRLGGSSAGFASTNSATPASGFGNYPLYIGARTGTSLYLNGRLYSLIVRGAQSSLSQIEATELYIKQKMRLP